MLDTTDKLPFAAVSVLERSYARTEWDTAAGTWMPMFTGSPEVYFADTGLLVSMLDDESQEDLRANKNLGVYKGALYENMVGEALIKQGYKLFYYKKEDSTLESDFFIRSATSLIPVEVKAKSGRAKSMKTLIASDHYPDIRYGFKLSKNNIGHENKIYTFPYFCSFLLKRFMSGFQAEEETEYYD